MIRQAKDLSPDQKLAIESLLGRSLSNDEEISIRALSPHSLPDWLQESWETAKHLGLDRLSMDEIDAEIAAARRERHERADRPGQ